MSTLLEKVNEKFLDDFFGILSLNRIFVIFLTLPLVLNLSAQEQGILRSYLSVTPLDVLEFSNGLLWQQSWAGWILLIAVSSIGIVGASVLRQYLMTLIGFSKKKEKYINSILISAKGIKESMPDTSAFQKNLLTQLNVRQKRLQTCARFSELLLAMSCVFLCFIEIWQSDDWWVAIAVTVLGLLIEWIAHRYYIASVAPAMLLHGFLADEMVQLEDDYLL